MRRALAGLALLARSGWWWCRDLADEVRNGLDDGGSR